MEYALRGFVDTWHKDKLYDGLNPYSNGICSTSREGHQGEVTLLAVLILILMEYALRADNPVDACVDMIES